MKLSSIEFFAICTTQLEGGAHRIFLKTVADRGETVSATLLHPRTAIRLAWKLFWPALKQLLTKQI